MALRTYVGAKLHGMTVTQANHHYRGSQGVPRSILKRAGIDPYEKVLVVNQDNGNRWETYAIPTIDGECTLNGAAAHLGKPGDKVIIMTFVLAESFGSAKVLFFNDANEVTDEQRYEGA